MAITGTWANNRVQSANYSGALKWGTGINPIHKLRDPVHKSSVTREPLGSTEQDNYVPESIIGPYQWGYAAEDMFVGEDYRYLQVDHLNWGQNSAGRADRASIDTYPSWGPHEVADPDRPLPGQPGGTDFRTNSHQLDVERTRAINVFTPGVSGGWVNKARSYQQEAQTSDPKQYEINTSMSQAHNSMTNTRATTRGTDDLRSPILSRTAAMKEKVYAKSYGMGGGSGAPDMRPFQQEVIYRPFYYRSAGVGPSYVQPMNEMEMRQPKQRVVPTDPYQGDYVTGAADYGYQSGDYYV